MAYATDGEYIRPHYKGYLKFKGREEQWANLLLAEKIGVVGGGLGGNWHRNSLQNHPPFKKLKKVWDVWWREVGSKRYAKTIKEAKKAFKNRYVKKDGCYMPRWQANLSLTDAEIRWIKSQYLKRNNY